MLYIWSGPKFSVAWLKICTLIFVFLGQVQLYSPSDSEVPDRGRR